MFFGGCSDTYTRSSQTVTANAAIDVIVSTSETPSEENEVSLSCDPSVPHDNTRSGVCACACVPVRVLEVQASFFCFLSCKCNYFSGWQLAGKHFPPPPSVCFSSFALARWYNHTALSLENGWRVSVQGNGGMSQRDVSGAVPLVLSKPQCGATTHTSPNTGLC